MKFTVFNLFFFSRADKEVHEVHAQLQDARNHMDQIVQEKVIYHKILLFGQFLNK